MNVSGLKMIDFTLMLFSLVYAYNSARNSDVREADGILTILDN